VVPALDVAAFAVLSLAVVRGLWIGLVREVFSVGALAAACIAGRYGAHPVAAWLGEHSPLALDPLAAVVAGALLSALAAGLAVALSGRFLARGLRAAGLGLADRAAGAVLGAAEGALVVALLVLLAGALVGRDHPALARSQALAAVQSAEAFVAHDGAARSDVAAPPRR
jgi:membrane protein required for colicin V production